MKEKEVLHESGEYWVRRVLYTHTIYKQGVTHSTPVESYPGDADGLSIAIVRCEWLAKRDAR